MGRVDLVFELGVAASLALDACTVTLAIAVALGGLARRQVFRLVWHFALFQALMPVIGWSGARAFESWIRAWDHWLAFGLLLGVGGKMILDGLGGSAPSTSSGDPTRGWSLVVLSVATSVDALAVGLSIGLVGQGILRPALLIGAITGAMAIAAAVFGGRLRLASAQRAGILGGLILILVGLRILVEHLS
jgi:putative Mn2+ efflux pump MntP